MVCSMFAFLVLLVIVGCGKGENVTYEVSTKTGSHIGAGTDANVYITIYGRYGQTSKHDLNTRNDDFENSNVDVFVFEDEDVGPISKIHLEQDNSGHYAGWYVEWVKVSYDSTSAVFLLNRWLSSSEGDHSLGGDFYPD